MGSESVNGSASLIVHSVCSRLGVLRYFWSTLDPQFIEEVGGSLVQLVCVISPEYYLDVPEWMRNVALLISLALILVPGFSVFHPSKWGIPLLQQAALVQHLPAMDWCDVFLALVFKVSSRCCNCCVLVDNQVLPSAFRTEVVPFYFYRWFLVLRGLQGFLLFNCKAYTSIKVTFCLEIAVEVAGLTRIF